MVEVTSLMVEIARKEHDRRAASDAAPGPPRNMLLYPIARDSVLNLLCVPLVSREEALVVFSSPELALSAILSEALPEEWGARTCSGGELVSLLFGPYKDIDWVLFDPLPGRRLEEETAGANLVSRERFVNYLLRRPTPRATVPI